MKTGVARASNDDRIAAAVGSLEQIKTDFRRIASAKRLRLLKKLGRGDIADANLLMQYHDLLSFVSAYPDDTKLRAESERQLRAFSDRVDNYRHLSRDPDARKLINSGFPGTEIVFPFGYDALLLLTRWHAGAIELDWDNLSEEESDAIFELLPLMVSWQENDALDNDPYLDTASFLTLARGRRIPSNLSALLRLFSQSKLPREVQRYLFEKLDLTATWELDNHGPSRTLTRVPAGRIYYQRGPRRGRSPDLRRELLKKATPLKRLNLQKGRKYVQVINEVLAVRYRELYPITFANPAEVYVSEPGRGIQIFLFGSYPEIRLPLETNYGAMLVRNGVPVGYGVGAVLFDRVEIAINVFPAFRSGESPFIIEQFFRIFYHHFGSRVLLVRSRQMGDGDDEPLKSGAFWFYYKLGFRAIEERVRKLAEQEYEVIRNSPGYRSPLKMLRRLSKSDVFLHVDRAKMAGYQELALNNLGKLVTKYFADNFNGDREEGTRRTVVALSRLLGVSQMNRSSEAEREAFARLAPLVACIPDLENWPRRERQSLIKVMRAKGSPQERKFVILSNKHKRFRDAIEQLAHAELPEEVEQ